MQSFSYKSKKPHFRPFLAKKNGQNNFFSKIGLRHFSSLIDPQNILENQKKLMAGNMRTFVTDGQTDRQTDGAGFIRTRGES